MIDNERILRFLVRLHAVEPQVWRRIEVPAWYSMWDLHVAIQDAMGWLDCHLHAFSINGDRSVQYGIPDDDGMYESEMGIRMEPGWMHDAASLFLESGDTALYEYDFGDCWWHDVIFEGSAKAETGISYPRCTGGAEPCPPEDCGGIGGFGQLLAAYANPRGREARDLLEWASGDVTRYSPWQPGLFDIDEIIFDDPRHRWRVEFTEGEDEPSMKSDEEFLYPSLLNGRTAEDDLIDRLIDAISYKSDIYDREVVEEIILRRDVMAPHLVEILVDTLQYPEVVAKDPTFLGHFYALLLIGHLRVTHAHAAVIGLASLPLDLPYRIFDDILIMEYPVVLLQTCGGDLAFIRHLALNPAVDVWGRTAGVDAMVFAVVLGICSREEALAFLSSVLDRCDAAGDSLLPSHIVYRLACLHAEEFIDPVERAFAAGIIDETYIDRERFDGIVEQGRDSCLDALREEWDRLEAHDIHARLEGWTCSGEIGLPAQTHPLDATPASPTGPKPAKKKNHRRQQAKQSRKKNRKK
ncbi:MAG: DUF1186 domain-containing protein [Bacteroidetes bacterium]|nr:DUF1186 domain-containing protein [Bacteroidota bacterium]